MQMGDGWMDGQMIDGCICTLMMSKIGLGEKFYLCMLYDHVNKREYINMHIQAYKIYKYILKKGIGLSPEKQDGRDGQVEAKEAP